MLSFSLGVSFPSSDNFCNYSVIRKAIVWVPFLSSVEGSASLEEPSRVPNTLQRQASRCASQAVLTQANSYQSQVRFSLSEK